MYPQLASEALRHDVAYNFHTRRQNSTDPNPPPPPPHSSGGGLTKSPWGIAVMVLVIVVLLFTASLFTYSHLRKLRLQHKVPRYIPGTYLKRKWMAWKPRGKYSSLDDTENAPSLPTSNPVVQPARSTVNPDRRISVRSIISLPAYSRTPKDTEEVIGREGERGGIDTVVEFPENADEEENRREEEMESLYQIRQTRRREIADREERRRQRREAREAGDVARLEELRQQTRERRAQNTSISGSNVNLTAESMIQEHNTRGRSRRISSVSYAAIGQVRHDGSRLRASSKDSERGGLLGQAAPMGNMPPMPHSRHGSEATSLLSLNNIGTRQRSDSGAPSVSSMGSSFDNVSRSEARPNHARNVSSTHNVARSVSSTSSNEADIGDEHVEPTPVNPGSTPLPPTYDAHDWGEAPEYEEQRRLSRLLSTASRRQRITTRDGQSEPLSSTSSRAPQLPSLQVTPTISIETPTQPNSPAVNRGSGFSPISPDHPDLR